MCHSMWWLSCGTSRVLIKDLLDFWGILFLVCVSFLWFVCVSATYGLLFTFLLCSIYIRRKYWIRESFLTSGFRCIYMFWDVLNTIWLFLENVCLSVIINVWCMNNYFVGSQSQKLMFGIESNLIFSKILTETGTY